MPYLGRLLCGSPLLLALILSKNWDFRGKNRATITIDLIVFIAIPLLPQNPNFFMGYDAEIV